MEVYTHSNVLCAKGTVKMFGIILNTFIYIDDEIMIDTGPSRFTREFAGFSSSYPVKKAVLTHYHEDHSGNAPLLEKRGVPVYINPTSVSMCKENARLPFYRFLFWGKRKKFNPYNLFDTVEGKSYTFEVINTPGHSHDHIALYNPQEGRIFTGDLFVTPRTRLTMPGESIPQIINSLKTILKKDFREIYCGHAGIIENGREMIKKKLDYLENLQGEVIELYHRGMDIKSINKKIFPRKEPIRFFSGKEWSSENLINSIIRESE